MNISQVSEMQAEGASALLSCSPKIKFHRPLLKLWCVLSAILIGPLRPAQAGRLVWASKTKVVASTQQLGRKGNADVFLRQHKCPAAAEGTSKTDLALGPDLEA